MPDYRFQAIKEFVQELLEDKRCLYSEDNILYCEKLFIVNKVMNHIYDKITNNELDPREMRKYLLYINKYLDDKVDLLWLNGKLVALNKTTGGVKDAKKEEN